MNESNICELAYSIIEQLDTGSAAQDGKAKEGKAKQARMLALVPSNQQAHELCHQLKFFGASTKRLTADDILLVPDNEVLIYDSFSPDPQLSSQRIEAIYRLLNSDYQVAVFSLFSFLRLLAPKSYFTGSGIRVRTGQAVDFTEFAGNLTESGYARCSHVSQPGEMAVRGSIIDIYPIMSSEDQPCRLEWLDDKIESLRLFEPEEQTSIKKIDRLNILPAFEFPVDAAARERFVENWQASFFGSARRHPIYMDIEAGRMPAGIESFLPLFFDNPAASFFDYFPDGCRFFGLPDLDKEVKRILDDFTRRWHELGGEEAVLLHPEKLFLSHAEFKKRLWKNSYKPILSARDKSKYEKLDLAVDLEHDNKLEKLLAFLDDYDGKVLLGLVSGRRHKLIKKWLGDAGINFTEPDSWQEFNASGKDISVMRTDLREGLITNDWALICERELFGNIIAGDKRKSASAELVEQLRDLSSFTPGELVVHEHYGLGRFCGLEMRETDNILAEYLVIEYAEKTKLYLPISKLNLLTSYSSVVGTGSEYPLDKLGSGKWNKRKLQAAGKARDNAAELLQIYAKRQKQQGIVFDEPATDYEEFVLGFPFDETDSQLAAIDEVIKDMLSHKKTDRLICGDVGFGKTEIAMRAAYLAVASGYQVSLLTPTTILATQHLLSFRSRFANTPFVINGLSRMEAGHTKIRNKLVAGQIDIIIGTHALLSKKVKFKKLGLVIIDEEHKFGVRQKEKLKEMHDHVDIISLTATPIPRTLNLALSNLRDISLLTSPPPGRLPIKTYTGLYNEELVKEAIKRELQRDGQVYYVFNDTVAIADQAEYLRKLFPEIKIAVVHGKMDSAQLEEAMHDFYHNNISVLVCTSIIENGLDIPNSNTIIISDAERFGLAQLHQLRGRVGRRSRQAFAYVMLSRDNQKNLLAVQRLKALRDNSELGMGFNLASHDLELRGGGEILGKEQSGFVQKVGVVLYAQMLTDAVKMLGKDRALKPRGFSATDSLGCEVQVALSAFFPHDYIAYVPERIRLYRQMYRADMPTLDKIQAELQDKYGPLPLFASNLFEIHKLRIKAQGLGIEELRITASRGYARLSDDYPRALEACEQMAEKEPEQYVFSNKILRFACEDSQGLRQIILLNNLLRSISANLPAAA